MRRMLAGVVAFVAAAAVLGCGGADERKQPSRDPLDLGARTIAYVCDLRICVWEGEGAKPRALTKPTALGDASPVWSPDGSRIAFLRGAGDRIDLYVMGADGSGATRVASGLAVAPLVRYGPPFAWSPDGTRLAVSLVTTGVPPPRTRREAFNAGFTGPPSDLHLVDLATRSTRRLTRGAGFDALPVWAGARIAYARLRDGDPRFGSDVRLVDPATGTDRRLWRATSTVNLVALEPGGGALTVATSRRDGPGLRTIDLSSGRAEVLVSRCCVSGLGWAPDAKRLAVAGIDGPLLYLADAATHELRPAAAGQPCLNPDWSPDGRSVICHRPYTDDDPQGFGSDLVLVDPATGKRAPLTRTGHDSDARWRPPGRIA